LLFGILQPIVDLFVKIVFVSRAKRPRAIICDRECAVSLHDLTFILKRIAAVALKWAYFSIESALVGHK
jgi:hypothetical protein